MNLISSQRSLIPLCFNSASKIIQENHVFNHESMTDGSLKAYLAGVKEAVANWLKRDFPLIHALI